MLPEALAQRGFPARPTFGNAFRVEHEQGTKACDAYPKIHSRGEAQEFRRQWLELNYTQASESKVDHKT